LWAEVETVSQAKQKLRKQAKRKKAISHYFPLAGRCSAISRKAGLHHVLFGKTNAITPQHPPSSLSPQICVAEHGVIRSGRGGWAESGDCTFVIL